MSELAFSASGENFEVPASVTGWRVRRMKPRGAPELVYGRDGRPLTVPIECDMDELRNAVTTYGRYRLDPIDDNGKVIDGVPAAYIQVVKPEVVSEEPHAPAPIPETESVLREALRMNTELAKAVVDRFPEMMHAAAELLRAADGAGLPRRLPSLTQRDDDDDDDDEESSDSGDVTPAGFDINTMVGQLVPVLMQAVMSGNLKLPNLAALFDWRKAAPVTTEAAPKKRKPKPQPAPAVENEAAPTPTTEPTGLPPIDPAMMGHFIAIQSSLSPEEAALAREVAGQLNPTELRAWFDELSKLSVPDAATKIRKVVSGAKGGAE